MRNGGLDEFSDAHGNLERRVIHFGICGQGRSIQGAGGDGVGLTRASGGRTPTKKETRNEAGETPSHMTKQYLRDAQQRYSAARDGATDLFLRMLIREGTSRPSPAGPTGAFPPTVPRGRASEQERDRARASGYFGVTHPPISRALLMVAARNMVPATSYCLSGQGTANAAPGVYMSIPAPLVETAS